MNLKDLINDIFSGALPWKSFLDFFNYLFHPDTILLAGNEQIEFSVRD